MKKQMTIIWLINQSLAKKRVLYWTPKQNVQVIVQDNLPRMVQYVCKEKEGDLTMNKQNLAAWLINKQTVKKEILDWTPKQHVQVNVQDIESQAV